MAVWMLSGALCEVYDPNKVCKLMNAEFVYLL